TTCFGVDHQMLHVPCVLYWVPLAYQPGRDEMPVRIENYYSPIKWISDVPSVAVCVYGYGRWIIKLCFALPSRAPNSEYAPVDIKFDDSRISLIHNVEGIIGSNCYVPRPIEARLGTFPLGEERSIRLQLLDSLIRSVGNINIPGRVGSDSRGFSKLTLGFSFPSDNAKEYSI